MVTPTSTIAHPKLSEPMDYGRGDGAPQSTLEFYVYTFLWRACVVSFHFQGSMGFLLLKAQTSDIFKTVLSCMQMIIVNERFVLVPYLQWVSSWDVMQLFQFSTVNMLEVPVASADLLSIAT